MRFDMVVFTGSTAKGKLVASSCGKNLVPCVLELGGKSPAIIDENCNPAAAAKKCLIGKMGNLGQVCIAPDYILCHESKVEAFVAEMKQFLVERFKNGDTTADSGKVVNEFHYNRLCDLLNPEDLGPDHKFAFGNPNAFKDRYLKPCLIVNVRKEAQVLQEEIFGPIFPLITYKHIDEAIDYINNE